MIYLNELILTKVRALKTISSWSRPPTLYQSHQYHWGWIMCILLLFTQPCFSTEPLQIPAGLDGKNLGHHVEILHDPEGRLSIDDVSVGSASTRFTPSFSDTPNLGYTKDTIWVRLPMVNLQDTTHSFLLEMSYPLMDRIEVFVKNNGQWTQRITGDHQPFNQREIQYPTYLFQVDLTPQEKTVYYFRFQSTTSMSIQLSAWEKQGFLEHFSHELTLMGIFCGIVLAMAIFNFFVFLATRDKSYLYLVIVIIHCLLFTTIMNGVAFQYFWPNQIWLANYSLPLTIAFSNLSFLQFTRTFLELRANQPRLDLLVRILQIGCVGIALAVPIIPYEISIRLLVIMSTITVIMILFIGIISLNQGYRAARIFLLAWTGLIFGNTILSLKVFGILPDVFLTRWSPQLGILALVLLISLALVDKLHILKKGLETLTTNLDKTVHERTHELAIANHELREMNMQKNQFFGIVAHDLRNPLNGIMLAAQLLDDEDYPKDVQHTARQINHEGVEMTALIGRFLDISRIESGQMCAEPEVFHLQEVIHHIANRHTNGGIKKDISLVFVMSNTPILVYADIKFMKEVLDNLISNAIKFSPREKIITIRAEITGGKAQISIEDQGPGLTKEDHAKLFGRFARLSAQPTDGEKSTGLGLSIVKHMVDSTGGRIWVESEPGYGAAFRVELPLPPDTKDIN